MADGDVKAAALDYQRRGWSVIPVRCRDKRPLVAWQRFQSQRAGLVEIHQWFQRWPDANVGVVTGAVSGLIVLDVDPKHGGAASLDRLQREYGSLPVTIEAETGGGGHHLYFAHTGGVIHNRAGMVPGIDLRGDGGYVVAPPSLHASGKRYRWCTTHEPWRTEAAVPPAWLLHAVADGERAGHPLAYWRQLLRAGVPEGERNNTIASLTGHLLWHGVDREVATELLLCWNARRCRPPLPDDEVVRTVSSIAERHRIELDERPDDGRGDRPS